MADTEVEQAPAVVMTEEEPSTAVEEEPSTAVEQEPSTAVEQEPSKTEEGAEVSSVVAEHYNKLEEKGLEERSRSRIFYLRNFNNWVKSMLIGEILQKLKKERTDKAKLNVLDIGCGKGGDLLKWKKGMITHLVCADIAETSLEQCEQRYKDIEERHKRQRERGECFSAEFIPADCTRVRLKEKYKDADVAFDLVSCQFTFHYSFESFEQAQCMLRNVSECLKPGGYFIGTTPDSYDLVKRLKESPELSFGNDVYSVNFELKDNFPLFGSKYDFHLEGVVDCPEFLVYFPLLEKMAEEHGLKLVFKHRFEDFFKEYENTEDGKFLLNKMRAMEPYPMTKGPQASTKTEDYVHTHERIETIKKGGPGITRPHHNPIVGTLTKSEWEAASLYLVFAFMKPLPEQPNGNKEMEEAAKAEATKAEVTEATKADVTEEAKAEVTEAAKETSETTETGSGDAPTTSE